MPWYLINVTVHVFAAVIWLGGMFFFALVGAPVIRKVASAELRIQLFRQLGEQFRTIGWICIATLLATGVLNLYFRGFLSHAVLTSVTFWQTRFGVALLWKLIAVASMLIVQAIHDFSVGPAASRVQPGTLQALSLRRRAALLARASAIIGIVVVIAAVKLARG
ncbi:MAG TPA: DUF4149 domain-containing protein [Longimicrobiales bacterium]